MNRRERDGSGSKLLGASSGGIRILKLGFRFLRSKCRKRKEEGFLFEYSAIGSATWRDDCLVFCRLRIASFNADYLLICSYIIFLFFAQISYIIMIIKYKIKRMYHLN